MIITSRLTPKFQVTVQTPVRKALHLKTGDMVSFDIERTRVTLSHVTLLDLVFVQAPDGTLDECPSWEDEQAFKDL